MTTIHVEIQNDDVFNHVLWVLNNFSSQGVQIFVEKNDFPINIQDCLNAKKKISESDYSDFNEISDLNEHFKEIGIL